MRVKEFITQTLFIITVLVAVAASPVLADNSLPSGSASAATTSNPAVATARPPSCVNKPMSSSRAWGNSNALSRAQGDGAAPMDMNLVRQTNDSVMLSKQGDKDAKAGNWSQAKEDYNKSLTLWAPNSEAIYGLGRCAEHNGDLATAIMCYRHNIYSIYSDTPDRYGLVPGDGFQENSVERLMQYALLLNEAQQVQEAVFIYNRAANLFNYYPDGNPNAPVPLPTMGLATGQVAYTPQRMKALADIALSLNEFDYNVELNELQEATQLSPDLAVTWFYLGRYHFGRYLPGSAETFHQAMQKVIQLDNGLAANKAREWLQIEK